jgi:FkbM family methyltransferase
VTIRRDLIFDIGVCNGDDSAYYLHKGYRVVGVEANPAAVEQLQERFRSEIDSGRYTLVAAGIAAGSGQSDFWVCDDRPDWSSFDRLVASRNGARHHRVPVTTLRFRSLLERFGTPFYCKIDVEGNDHFCLEEIDRSTAPAFISVEASDGEREIRRLAEIGYTKFKVVSQSSHRQLPLALMRSKSRLPFSVRQLVEKLQIRLWRRRPDGNWRFQAGSSGPFGEETRGQWLSADEASELNRLFEAGSGHLDWQDIHATF